MMQPPMMHNVSMRTTFTPAPDVAERIREIAITTRRSMSAVVNDLLRVALRSEREPQRPGTPYKVKARDMGLRTGIDPLKLGEALMELEVDEFGDSRH